jgi:hypothetical protein
MLTKYLFLSLSLFFVYSCAEQSQETLFKRERDKRVHNALSGFTTAMLKKGIYAVGLGEGIDHSNGKQNYIGVTFNIEKLPSVDFARKIEVETIQECLRYINHEEGIKDYIAEYPYPLKFIRIGFISHHPQEGLFSVSNCENELIYRKDGPEQPGPSIIVHEESYEEAVRILAEQETKHK